MAIIENDAILRGKIRAVASKRGLRAHEVCRCTSSSISYSD